MYLIIYAMLAEFLSLLGQSRIHQEFVFPGKLISSKDPRTFRLTSHSGH